MQRYKQKHLIEFRYRNRLTQGDVARLLLVSQSCYSRYERGEYIIPEGIIELLLQFKIDLNAVREINKKNLQKRGSNGRKNGGVIWKRPRKKSLSRGEVLQRTPISVFK